MNLTHLKIQTIKRIVAHEIQAKTEKKDAVAMTRASLLDFDKSEKDILIKRITEAISNTTKTFQLDYEDKSESSIYSIMKKYKSLDDKEFIKQSINLAENLADAHFRTKIPGGYCLIGDGITSAKKISFCHKS